VRAFDSAHVEASGSAHVEASDSAYVRAFDSAHVEASGSAHVRAFDSTHVRAFGSAHVEASGSAHVEASGSAHVRAFGSVFIRLFGAKRILASSGVVIMEHKKADYRRGGNIIRVKEPSTAQEWCEHWGAAIKRGVVILYKCVDNSYGSSHDSTFKYMPGTIPIAPDWDGGVKECGGGLHFSSTPMIAKSYNPNGSRYVACPVALDDIAVMKNAQYPDKIKARGCCGKVYEVDIHGDRIVQSGEADG
jgi:hypothetical protein